MYLSEQAVIRYNQQGDRPALPSALVDEGEQLIRDWIGWNWGEIKDGGEPGLRTLVQELLSLARSRESLDR